MEGRSRPAAVLAGWRASAAGKDDRSIGSSGPVVSSAGQRTPVRGGLIKSHRRLSHWAGQRQPLTHAGANRARRCLTISIGRVAAAAAVAKARHSL